MAIQIDDSTKTITLSVRDLCGAEATGGSLNLSPLSGARNEIGREIHSAHQATQAVAKPAYRKELSLRYTMNHGEYPVVIHGRVDGAYEERGQTVIEEIKSVLSVAAPFESASIPDIYALQLKIYLHLWKQIHPDEVVTGRLTLISCEPERVLTVAIEPDSQTVEALIRERLQQAVKEYEASCRLRTLKQAASSLRFPFPQMRKYQDRMVEAIDTALAEGRSLLVSAPTGIGKTVAALYAALRFAARNRLSIFFLTSKTTQQRIVADTLRLWDAGTAPGRSLLDSLILRSKDKSCANDVVFCHEARCPYAKDFFGKLSESNALQSLLGNGLITPERVYAKAIEHELCPFELSLELLEKVDVTVCDYNYVYDPRVALERLTDRARRRAILIVDEAHNLYGRAREYYSPQIDLAPIQQLRRSVELVSKAGGNEASQAEFLWPQFTKHEASFQPSSPKGTWHLESGEKQNPPIPRESRLPVPSFLERLAAFLGQIEAYFGELIESGPEVSESGQAVLSLDQDFFQKLRTELDELMRHYLLYKRRSGELQDEDKLLECFYRLSDFCRVLEMQGDELVQVIDIGGSSPRLKIVCLDPAPQLAKVNRGFHSVIAMSATLSPMEFYRDVLGFDRDTQLLSLPSPFPPEHRKVVIVPQVSTTYRQRTGSLPAIARIIEEAIAIRPGNYFAFFPSFEFLREVAGLLKPPDYEVLIQSPYMPDHHRSALLERLDEKGKSHLVLAVQGGVFAEGVDYPGELAVGAIIVGPGLPKVSFEQELMRLYYEECGSNGFEYAYLYPGMNRVVQSAGRVIRTETDRGVILLLDKRFTYENYARLLPRDWYDASPEELFVKDYRKALSAFWHEA